MTSDTQTLQLHGLVQMSNEQYQAADGVSKSQLDTISPLMFGSPLNHWDRYINPDREPQDYKHCFAVGDGTHKLVLEPGTFEKIYAVGFDKSQHPDALDTVADLKKECSVHGLMVSGSKPELVDRLMKEAGVPASRIILALDREHAKTIAGRIPMPARDYKNMMSMLRAINADKFAASLLRNAQVEQSFFVTDENGVLRKCRTDLIPEGGEIIGDLKTTEDVSKAGFGRTIAQRRYHVQAAWYLDILKLLYGSDAPQYFAFIAAQKNRPYDVAVHYLTDDQIAEGRRLYQIDLALLMQCREANYWPGAANGQPIEAELPRWAMQGDHDQYAY